MAVEQYSEGYKYGLAPSDILDTDSQGFFVFFTGLVTLTGRIVRP